MKFIGGIKPNKTHCCRMSESGLITLIGATTENPSFEVISALLSRSRIFVLEGLTWDDLTKIMNQGLKKSKKRHYR